MDTHSHNLPGPGQMYESQTIQTRYPAVSQSVDTHHDQIRDQLPQLPPVLDKLTDSLSDLKNTMSTLTTGNTGRESQVRDDRKKLPVSDRKFDVVWCSTQFLFETPDNAESDWNWKFRMTVVRFLALTGGSGLSLCVGCVGDLKPLDCIKFMVGFLRISLNNVRV